MIRCPACQDTDQHVKHGRHPSGNQRYLCRGCGHRYTREPKRAGYPAEIRAQAVRMYVDGMNLRRIARHLGVVHQSVANWVTAHADALSKTPPVPSTVETAELDELFTFVGAKKRRLPCNGG